MRICPLLNLTNDQRLQMMNQTAIACSIKVKYFIVLMRAQPVVASRPNVGSPINSNEGRTTNLAATAFRLLYHH